MGITSERIKQAMELRGLKQADIVERTGINKGALSSYISGRYNPKQNNTYLIAKALNVSEAWLMGADVPMERPRESQVNVSSFSIGSCRIPVYSAAGAGKPQPTSDDILFYTDYNGDPDGVLGVQIKGDSMAPTIPDNSLVIVNSNLQIESGDIVVAQVNSDHEALCKRIKKYEDGLSLISDNPAYPPLYFTAQQVQELPVRFVGKCTEVRKKL